MAQGDQDKTEQPTQHRLEEARKQGQVAKSADVVSVLGVLVFAVTFLVLAAGLVGALTAIVRQLIGMAGARPHLSGGFAVWFGQLLATLGPHLIPLVLALVVAALASNVLQTGPVFSAHPVRPDFKRMHPGNTIKRLFSMRTLWELGKLMVKMGLLAVLCWFAVIAAPGFVGTIATAAPAQLAHLLLDSAWTTTLYVVLILGALAGGDLLFMRRDHLRQMRMSRRELRDENKQRDGDPEVKGKQKRSIRELLKKTRALQRVAEADVVVTNPTHYAIALQYRPKQMRAPVVLAKGSGFLAARVREMAQRAGVVVIPAPPLARALYRQCEIDGAVPEELYGQLAPVYRQLYVRRRSQ